MADGRREESEGGENPECALHYWELASEVRLGVGLGSGLVGETGRPGRQPVQRARLGDERRRRRVHWRNGERDEHSQ